MCKKLKFKELWVPAVRAVVLGLLCSLPVTRASAQVPCIKCPTDAIEKAATVGFDVYVDRGAGPVSVGGTTVGACETLLLISDVAYAPKGPTGKTGAGFSGGNG